MIGLRSGARKGGRSGRVGLLLGLVVLIATHLAGAVHGASFGGPHMSIVATACPHRDADSHGGTMAPSPGHEHRTDGHIDHAADRPRAAADDAAADPDRDALSPIPSETPGSVAGQVAWRRPPGVSRAPDGSSTLAFHCVWRQ
ncbi:MULTISPECIES: hypothetical protein [unclassified Streptomyces]|uniref:hypothetical protein n=1 Tax=unclassified Streptomyces TaxID=2593676 RepID=UPI002E80F0DD|nr:hypothetical protein [Streptomyces sp. NBC_00589]WTI35063.1 hypothetical protein OIC96_08710 [Streptomyces sp. NBC_00775]WUB31263.1 hypothetical protein OHA51_41020 [Streptomyces sp. NBC_00589]